MQGIWFVVFGRIRYAVDVDDDYAFPSLADIERLCRRHNGAIYVLYQLGNAGLHDTPCSARLCLKLNRPRVIMLVSFAAFVLNVPLNYVFVYGKFGMPALGGAGCGVATAAVFWFSALALWLYIAKEKNSSVRLA